MSDAMIILFIIWWCIMFLSMCVELLYHIYIVVCFHLVGTCDEITWITGDTPFYTTIIFLITEAMLFIWR